ncbi:myelin protein P0 isoform X3 [Gambusia affinis]|uniref:myelin protein P0 isoform X3 n=1 Tax=Gambusia affinis TaxID=33528 RepID=UPI001CDD61FF|nr:myelin protein P0 isoform X3 [Gambusia affinis]
MQSNGGWKGGGMGRAGPGMRGVVGYKPGDSGVSVVVLSLLAFCSPSSTLFFFWFFPSPPSSHAPSGVGTLPRQSPVRFAASVHFLGGSSNRSQKTMLRVLALASVVLLGIAPQASQAITVYTSWERHALVGSDVRLSCTFFSWRFISDDVSFTWRYRADGSRDTVSIAHYAGGEAYTDNKGVFKDRVEFVGNPKRRDGSILIKNLDFSDNGTFTCDAKNPPDIVGRPSSVRLLVFENLPIQAGVITGAIIGVVLGLLVLIVVIYYLMRFLVARRVFSLNVSKHGKKKKEGSQQRQIKV